MKGTWILVLVLLAPLSTAIPSAPREAVALEGSVAGGVVLTATMDENGVSGFVQDCAKCSRSDIVQVVPPGGGREHWCVTGRSPSTFVTLYVLNVGDGVRSLDKFVLSVGASTCAHRPDPPVAWQTVQGGNFIEIRSAL